MAASDVLSEEEGVGEESFSGVISAHMQDQADENLKLKELLDKLDDQANGRNSMLKELLEELETLSGDSSAVQDILDAAGYSEFEKKLALM